MINDFLVSIITPCYNSDIYISESIESVLSQSYLNWEMIIIDDASTDNSKYIIERYAQSDTRIKVLTNSNNQGATRSRNRAIEEARGKYVAFLDDDDIWLSYKLEKQINFMRSNQIFFCFSEYFTIDEQGKNIGYFCIKEPIVNYKMLLKTSSIGTLTMIYDVQELGKCFFKEYGHEDYIMKLELLKRTEFAYSIIEPLAKYRIRTNSLSSNKFKTALWQWKIYRKIENLSILSSIRYFINYTYYGLRKYKKV